MLLSHCRKTETSSNLGLGTTGDWKKEIRTSAEESAKQKLVFYYVVREENLIPTDEEYMIAKDTEILVK